MNYSYYNPAALQQPYQLSFAINSPSSNNVDDVNESAMSQNSQTAFEYSSFHGSSYFSGPGGAVLLPPQQHQQQSPSSATYSRHNSRDLAANTDHLGQYIFSEFLEDPLAVAQRSTRSSSEEKDVTTPAQDRRKAQNRAAQRAFRERKERRVKELEQKLTDLQAQSMTLHADNERLKRELAKVATENEILRSTSTTGDGMNEDNSNSSSPIDDERKRALSPKSTATATATATAIINGPKNWPARIEWSSVLRPGRDYSIQKRRGI